MFLKFHKFQPRYSYKIIYILIKTKECYEMRDSSLLHTFKAAFTLRRRNLKTQLYLDGLAYRQR